MERTNKPLPKTKNKFYIEQRELLECNRNEELLVHYTQTEIDKHRAAHLAWNVNLWMTYL
mgnify:FL=1